MKYKVKYDKRFIKDLQKIPAQFIGKIQEAVENLSYNPRPYGYKKLKGHKHLYRIRIGDYRIGYEILDDQLIILIILVTHRREIYREL